MRRVETLPAACGKARRAGVGLKSGVAVFPLKGAAWRLAQPGMTVALLLSARRGRCSFGPSAVKLSKSRKVDSEIMNAMTLKKLVLTAFALSLFAVLLLNNASVRTVSADEKSDAAAALFTAKCKMCHGAKAEKLFDPARPEEEMVEAILKGKKAEKPPNMPAYETKGVDAEQAKALIAYMKSLRQ